MQAARRLQVNVVDCRAIEAGSSARTEDGLELQGVPNWPWETVRGLVESAFLFDGSIHCVFDAKSAYMKLEIGPLPPDSLNQWIEAFTRHGVTISAKE